MQLPQIPFSVGKHRFLEKTSPDDELVSLVTETLTAELFLPHTSSVSSATLMAPNLSSARYAHMVMSVLRDPSHACALNCARQLVYLNLPFDHPSLSPLYAFRSLELLAVVLAGLRALPPTPTPTSTLLATSYATALLALARSPDVPDLKQTYHHLHHTPAAMDALLAHCVLGPLATKPILWLMRDTQEPPPRAAMQDVAQMLMCTMEAFTGAMRVPEGLLQELHEMGAEESADYMCTVYMTPRMVVTKVLLAALTPGSLLDEPAWELPPTCACEELLEWLLQCALRTSTGGPLPWPLLEAICSSNPEEARALLQERGSEAPLPALLQEALQHVAVNLAASVSASSNVMEHLQSARSAVGLCKHVFMPTSSSDPLWQHPARGAAALVPSAIDSAFSVLEKLNAVPAGSKPGRSAAADHSTGSEVALANAIVEGGLRALKRSALLASMHQEVLQPGRVASWLEAAWRLEDMAAALMEEVADALMCEDLVAPAGLVPRAAPAAVTADDWRDGALQLQPQSSSEDILPAVSAGLADHQRAGPAAGRVVGQAGSRAVAHGDGARGVEVLGSAPTAQELQAGFGSLWIGDGRRRGEEQAGGLRRGRAGEEWQKSEAGRSGGVPVESCGVAEAQAPLELRQGRRQVVAVGGSGDGAIAGARVCAACGGEGMERCGGCRQVRYCGKECQKRDWGQHKGVCKRLREQAAAAGVATCT